jgi:lipopolysaccharide transport system ATP-binding protein
MLLRGPAREREVWALSDVGFEVEEGRTLGVIGHNGAGKSTLLRVLCGVTRPTRGVVSCRGTVAGLLELGGGFKLELTGRQNLMTAGLLNGFSAKDVRAREAGIVAFAELEDVIDRPVRTYSSGMFLRLAFSAAVHFDPAILVIDEVLSVGDARFQSKCLARIAEFRDAGKTLVVASHVSEQIRSLCDDVLVLDEGRVAMIGPPAEALRRYDELMEERTRRRAHELGREHAQSAVQPGGGMRMGTQEGAFEAVRLRSSTGAPVASIAPGDSLTVELDVRLPAAGADFVLSIGVFSELYEKCFEVLYASGIARFGVLGERAGIQCTLPSLPLLPGTYAVVVGLYPPGIEHAWDYHWNMHRLHVTGERGPGQVSGVLNVQPAWRVIR